MNEDKLRRILRAEVDTIEPSPAAWDRIKDGVVVRRRRRLWLRSSAAAVCALSLVAVTALVVSRGDDSNRANIVPATEAPSPESSPSDPAPSPTGESASIAADDPLPIVWPFSTRREIDTWSADGSRQPFLRTSEGAAKEFVRTYLGLVNVRVEKIDAVQGGGSLWSVSQLIVSEDETAWVVIARMYLSAAVVDESGPRAPYVVRSVEAGRGLTLTSPTFDEVNVARSPLHVTGTLDLVDQSVKVEVRTTDAATLEPEVLGENSVVTDGQPWSTRVSFSRPESVGGAVVASTVSPADGQVWGIAITPIAFASSKSSTDSSTDAAAYPAQFVAVGQCRIGVYETRTGRSVRFLTDELPCGAPLDPSVTPDGKSVVYVERTGACAAEIRKVPIAGGAPELLVSSGDRLPSNPVLSSQNDLAYVDSPCDESSAPRIVIQRSPSPSTNNQRVLPGDPDTALRGLSWSSNGATLAVVVVELDPGGGDADTSTIRGIDARTQSVLTATVLARTTPNSYPGCGWRATAQPAKVVGVMVCGDGQARPPLAAAYELAGGDLRRITSFEGRYATSISADSSGHHLLFDTRTADDAPTIYRFSVDGDPIKVADSLTQPAWVG